jgi:hypothetical protein
MTREQEAVVRQPADAMLFVTAGPGAGKTHTLVRRIEWLVGEGGLDPDEILVLTFSRAAVRQLRNRIAGTDGEGRYVRASTFDSWALALLSEVDAGGGWSSRTFDERIRAATAVIRDDRSDVVSLDKVRHVVVDEVQDLVGERREMVQAILEEYECGFTVVGDLAQSIYGFQILDASRRSNEVGAFFGWLRSTFGPELVELALTRNFRAGTAEARTALPFGPQLLSAVEQRDEECARRVYEDLRTALMSTLDLGNLKDELVGSSLRDDTRTTAILCRANGGALLVSETLHDAGVPHRLQRAAEDRAAPSWIGMLYRRATRTLLSREAFEEAAELLPAIGRDLATSWRPLQRVAAAVDGRALDLGRLRQALRVGRLPDELMAQPPTNLVVSSFHRAKGLEFDRVVVVDPGPLRKSDTTDAAEEARALYVAMTRPRQELFRLAPVDTRRVQKNGGDRLARLGREPWQRLGMEVRGGDVHIEEPAGTTGFRADPVKLQDRFAADVLVGTPVVLERADEEPSERGVSPAYLVVHDGSPIGVTSIAFHRALYRTLKRNTRHVPRHFPVRIDNIRIDAIETVAGSEASGITAGLGNHGVWLAPRLVGLGRFHWETKDENA